VRALPAFACFVFASVAPTVVRAQDTQSAGPASNPTATTTTTTTTPVPESPESTANGQEPTAAPAGPGSCPVPAADTIRRALERSAAGDATADLDLAACWRLLEQPYPEAVALARALDRGLSEDDAAAALERLEELGGPPASVPPSSASRLPTPDVSPTSPLPAPDPLPSYVLAGVAVAGLLAGTVTGLAALQEHTRGEHGLLPDTLEEELGIAAGVSAGIGLLAGILSLALWPSDETGPTAGPGEVGLGWEVRF
jgi:hypothetical protein